MDFFNKIGDFANKTYQKTSQKTGELAKEAKIKQAEAEAESILKIQEATAQGLKLLKDAKMDEAVLKLKSYEAMVNVANGNATKIIVPSDLQGIVTAGTVLKETFDKKEDK